MHRFDSEPIRRRIAVFAKVPLAGYSKTRLIPRLGAHGAAALHACLVERTLSIAKTLPDRDISLWCAPDRHAPFFDTCQRKFAVTLHDQTSGDLGERMHGAFASLATDGSQSVVLIGTDCPALNAMHLSAAHAALDAGDDAVALPTEDGGYALIGLRRPAAHMFKNIAWSTPDVMSQTRDRLCELGWRWTELPTLWDVDEPGDYDRLLHYAESDPVMSALLATAAQQARGPGAA